MPQNFTINVEFRIGKGFVIPGDIHIPVNSFIEWNIIDLNVNQSSRRFYQTGLRFELYFQNNSPFEWVNKATDFTYERSRNLGGLEYQLQPKLQTLATGIASEKGDFKYGVKVTQFQASDPIYDEDPWLHVF